MKKFIRRILVLLLSFPFIKKIRIFHLILSVIAVMVIFTAIQGYMVLTFIDMQQKTNQKMFSSAVQFRNEIDTLKSDLFLLGKTI